MGSKLAPPVHAPNRLLQCRLLDQPTLFRLPRNTQTGRRSEDVGEGTRHWTGLSVRGAGVTHQRSLRPHLTFPGRARLMTLGPYIAGVPLSAHKPFGSSVTVDSQLSACSPPSVREAMVPERGSGLQVVPETNKLRLYAYFLLDRWNGQRGSLISNRKRSRLVIGPRQCLLHSFGIAPLRSILRSGEEDLELTHNGLGLNPMRTATHKFVPMS